MAKDGKEFSVAEALDILTQIAFIRYDLDILEERAKQAIKKADESRPNLSIVES